MIGVVCIYLTAWGITGRLPDRLKRWVGLRALRSIMVAQGVPLDGYSDSDVEVGVRSFAKAIGDRPAPLAAAPSLRDTVRDESRR